MDGIHVDSSLLGKIKLIQESMDLRIKSSHCEVSVLALTGPVYITSLHLGFSHLQDGNKYNATPMGSLPGLSNSLYVKYLVQCQHIAIINRGCTLLSLLLFMAFSFGGEMNISTLVVRIQLYVRLLI